MSEPLLEIKNLVTGFETESGLLKAVDGVSFTVPKGTCVGIVGESGCGKSVTAMSIVRLLPQPMGKILDGQILFKGRDLVQAKETDMHGIRGRHIGVIFQEPMTALNPVHSIGRQIGESLMLHRGMNAREARDAAIQLLQRVRIPAPEQRVDEFPHQLSGGMRQRVVIAIALACHPELIIADEPTTALDVTVQAQILSLLKDLQAEMGSSSILITHDLGVIAQSCDSVVVMYAGRVVEKAPVGELFANPRHAYTKGLLASIPQLSSVRKTKLPTIPGQVASIADFVPGCRFCQRQRIGIARALTLNPSLIILDEPVSALDVSVQSQVLNLLLELQEERKLSYLFIAHDLAVVKHISDRVAVMYLGKIVEMSDAETIYRSPKHAYTKALLDAIPEPDPARANKHQPLPGDVPSPINPPLGSAFGHRIQHPSYPETVGADLTPVEIEPGHWVAPDPCSLEPEDWNKVRQR